MEHFNWFTGAVLPYINFFVFLGLAYWFFRGPLADSASKRRDQYLKDAEQAQKRQREAANLNQSLRERQARLDAELAAIKNRSEQAAQEQVNEIIRSANELAEHIKKEAKRVADAEVQLAQQSLREQVVRSVIEQVEQKARRELDDTAQKNLVKRQIDALEPFELRS